VKNEEHLLRKAAAQRRQTARKSARIAASAHSPAARCASALSPHHAPSRTHLFAHARDAYAAPRRGTRAAERRRCGTKRHAHLARLSSHANIISLLDKGIVQHDADVCRRRQAAGRQTGGVGDRRQACISMVRRDGVMAAGK